MTTGNSKTRRPLIGFLGPALVAGVAYLDPGNVATNLAAGSSYKYLLVWVVVGANLAAWLFQFLSAKLGLVTGQSLPRILGQRIQSNWLRRLFWLQAELVVIATDVAEVIGGAIALNLLFDLPLLAGGLVTSALSLLLVAMRARGRGRFNAIIIGLLLVTAVGFSVTVASSHFSWLSVAQGLAPQLTSSDSIMLASAMIGATIMPHAIYAHSSLSRDGRLDLGVDLATGRATGSIPQLLKMTKLDVTLALGIAGIGNLAILIVGAANLSAQPGGITIANAYAQLGAKLGSSIGLVFAIALLASGLASSAVGNYAASELTVGLLRKSFSPLRRWMLAMGPALVILVLAPNVTTALIFSQVVLSLGLPFALFPLVRFTSSKKLMGEYVNGRLTILLGGAVAVALTALNLVLVASAIF